MKPPLRVLLIVTIALIFTALACGTFTGLSTQTATDNQPPSIQLNQLTPNPSLQNTSLDLIGQENVLISLYQRINPGVVAIRVLSEEGGGLGSGFVIDTEGHIVTNYHVVRDATQLEVDFPSGFKARGEILGTDSDSDIAVLKVVAPIEELVPLPMGDSDSVRVGQTVVAIGNPLGYESTMTTGIISSLGRTMASLHEAPGGGSFFTAGDIIQTDAAINPGNSGGPLLNMNGEVIGVNVAIEATSLDIFGQPVNNGIGFAISINIVKRVVPYLISEGSYDYPYLGISSIGELNLFLQEELELPQSTGVYVTYVTPDSPADKAGFIAGDTPTASGYLAGGDLIVAVDGQDVFDFGDMITYLVNHKNPGETVIMTVIRGEKTLELALTLGKRP
jgi:S1-C subfamily serine protease